MADPNKTSFTWPGVLGRILKREDLTEAEASAAMGSVLAGEATSAQIAAFAAGLRIKGETVTEMTGLVRAMLDKATPIDLQHVRQRRPARGAGCDHRPAARRRGRLRGGGRHRLLLRAGVPPVVPPCRR